MPDDVTRLPHPTTSVRNRCGACGHEWFVRLKYQGLTNTLGVDICPMCGPAPADGETAPPRA